ncbi:MAG: TonB-dependent receptor [Pseudomonadota bacterium]
MTITALKGSAATALALVLIAPQGAFAQDIPFDLGTLVLEGERSDRPLEEAPASITVITGEDADRPANTNVAESLSGIPNVYYDPTSFRLPTIRGIEPTAGAVGAGAITAGAQARVNVIVDGVARPQLATGNVSAGFGLWDTQQVEVARGPQSTLGGRNSLSGNIRIQTNDPVHFFEGAARVFAYDQDGTVGGALMLNTPIVQDQVALRFTSEISSTDSFIAYTDPSVAAIKDDLETREFERYRAKLLITPDAAPNLELLLFAERNEVRGALDNVADAGTFENTSDNFSVVGFLDNTQHTFGTRLRYNLSDNVEFEVRYSYLDNDSGFPTSYSDVTEFEFAQDTNTHSVEALLRAKDIGILNRGVIGVTYDKDEDDINGAFTGFGTFLADGEVENYSLYAEADIAVSDRLAFIVGGRLERQTETRLFQFSGGGQEIDNDETVFIPKVGLRYDLSEVTTIGYQYSEGFRAGGLDFDFIDPANGFAEFGSETLRQHEVYARMASLDGRWTLNTSAFFYQLDDAQTPGATAAGGFRLRGNVPEIEGYGLEVDGSYDFGNGFLMTAGLGLLQTEITDAGTVVPQFQGDDAPSAPNVTASLGLQYASANGWDAYARIRHVGSFTDSLGGAEVGNYTTLDIGGGYDFELSNGNTLRVDAFVNNLTDERVVTGRLGTQEFIGAPRTIGISGTVRF